MANNREILVSYKIDCFYLSTIVKVQFQYRRRNEILSVQDQMNKYDNIKIIKQYMMRILFMKNLILILKYFINSGSEFDNLKVRNPQNIIYNGLSGIFRTLYILIS